MANAFVASFEILSFGAIIVLVVLGLVLGWVMLAVLGPVYDTISKMKF